MKLSLTKVCIVSALAAAAVCLYFSFDPEQHRFFPKCTVLALTGYKCPGCGIQRFFYHLLHGDVLTAIRYNYFAVIVLPWALAVAACYLLPDTQCVRKLHDRLTSSALVYGYITLYFVWWIVRNMFGL